MFLLGDIRLLTNGNLLLCTSAVCWIDDIMIITLSSFLDAGMFSQKRGVYKWPYEPDLSVIRLIDKSEPSGKFSVR